MYINDTIAAISTPLGEGGIGVIRISGDRAAAIGAALFRGKNDGGFQSHRFYYGHIVEPAAEKKVDEVMTVFMKAPRSYTCEDVLEIHCHGGYLMVQRVLSLVLRQGARLAEAGEFTRRAFLNGRIDLVQAEAVIDIIRGKTDAALALAEHQREGLLSRKINEIRVLIVDCLALIEAYIDFPDESMEQEPFDGFMHQVIAAHKKCTELLDGYDEGRALREGVSVVIAGKPNVGKSSLMNAFLREKRAIVTAIPGTTRDVIEEVINVRGLPVKLLDTAGICDTDDEIEKEGVCRSLEKIRRADLILFVLDGSRPLDDNDLAIKGHLAGKEIIQVLNKCDLKEEIELSESFANHETIRISARNETGMDNLQLAIFNCFLHGKAVDGREYVALSNARHRDSLEKCRLALKRIGIAKPAEMELEIIAADLREALHAVGEVTGETTTDEVLGVIFQRFCIGK